MDSKTRVLMAIEHQKPDRCPFNFWMDRRLMARYEKKYNHRHWRVTHYGADVIETFAQIEFPSGKMVEHDGSMWLQTPYEMDWANVEQIPMPNASEEKVYELIKADIEEFPNVAVILDIPTCWGIIANMRGYERIYMDMMDYPDEFKKLAQKITDTQKVLVEKACNLGIAALYIQEDVASTKGLVMSPDTINEFCLDYARQLAEIAISKNIPVFFHCCGSIIDLLEHLIKIGVKAVNPLQPHLNDLDDFKKRFGSDLVLYGGIDNTYTIAQGNVEQVREHIAGVFNKVGKDDGGLIFSSHDISIDSPGENIEAMVDAIKNSCRY